MVTIDCFMGKGGVGKTTLSVEYAHILQKNGRNTCIVGLDQQHNAQDVLKSRGYDIPYFGLYAWDRMSAMVKYIVDNTFMKQFKDYVPLVAPDFITLCALAELLVEDGKKFENVVIDFPPNHSGLSMLNAPDLLATWAWKAFTVKGRVKRLLGRSDAVLDNSDYIWATVREFKEKIKSARMWAVTLPSELSTLESLKLVAYLRKLNYVPAGFIMNVFPSNECQCAPCKNRWLIATDWLVYLKQQARQLSLNVEIIKEGAFEDLRSLIPA